MDEKDHIKLIYEILKDHQKLLEKQLKINEKLMECMGRMSDTIVRWDEALHEEDEHEWN